MVCQKTRRIANPTFEMAKFKLNRLFKKKSLLVDFSFPLVIDYKTGMQTQLLICIFNSSEEIAKSD